MFSVPFSPPLFTSSLTQQMPWSSSDDQYQDYCTFEKEQGWMFIKMKLRTNRGPLVVFVGPPLSVSFLKTVPPLSIGTLVEQFSTIIEFSEERRPVFMKHFLDGLILSLHVLAAPSNIFCKPNERCEDEALLVARSSLSTWRRKRLAVTVSMAVS